MHIYSIQPKAQNSTNHNCHCLKQHNTINIQPITHNMPVISCQAYAYYYTLQVIL